MDSRPRTIDTTRHIKPQEGPQFDFLRCRAEFAIFGGAAGGGKSYALLMEALRHYDNPLFSAIIFRRNSTHIRNPGGLWDTSMELYHPIGGHPRNAFLEWHFPSGARLKMAHLENADTVYSYQGSQIPLIMWDELVHFEEAQLWYMFSRLRSMSGIPGYMRATCNPDSNSWVRKLVDWYIGEDGYPIPERSGVVRWFIRQENEIVWGSSREELIEKHGKDQLPKSFTFIPSKIQDNKILMNKDPSYLSNLMALPRVERLRLLGGNWNVRATSGTVFQRGWFDVLEISPNSLSVVSSCRYWDRAATEPHEENKDPDWTVGVKVLKTNTGMFIISHVARMRGTPLKVEQFIKNIAQQDGKASIIGIEQDPGSAGVSDAENYVRLLAGFNVRVRKVTKDKLTRSLPLSAQCEAGNVKLLRGEWNEPFLNELENFGEDVSGHDDQVDAASGAFNELAEGSSVFDYFRNR